MSSSFSWHTLFNEFKTGKRAALLRPHSPSFLKSFWQFSRPHTIIGTTLSVFALYGIALAIGEHHFKLSQLATVLPVWLACLAGNVYIVGLNQLTDVAIDRINKPHLPLASGAFSNKQGNLIVMTMGISAIAIAALSGLWLFATVTISLIIGTAYSLQPFRLKRFPLLAAICILAVRGVVVNLGLFAHYNSKFSGQVVISNEIWLLTAFIFFFSLAIAIFKDVPDLEGDKQYNIATFSLILGKAKVFQVTLLTISICYFGAITTALTLNLAANTWLFVSSHFALLVILWWRSRDVDLEDKNAIASFYQFIWKLFFLEYILFPLACWI